MAFSVKRSNIWHSSHHLRRAGTLILAQAKLADACIKKIDIRHELPRLMGDR
ncbi:hypothetical protein [Mastigocladopsis repens]|uniref:hypothetical protein n=1 Tax=Mastigocladopsis repens TaxID=221287 RepID=UPI0003196454|nr:hypothetical protein [Mastigocladopsis repens]